MTQKLPPQCSTQGTMKTPQERYLLRRDAAFPPALPPTSEFDSGASTRTADLLPIAGSLRPRRSHGYFFHTHHLLAFSLWRLSDQLGNEFAAAPDDDFTGSLNWRRWWLRDDLVDFNSDYERHCRAPFWLGNFVLVSDAPGGYARLAVGTLCAKVFRPERGANPESGFGCSRTRSRSPIGSQLTNFSFGSEVEARSVRSGGGASSRG